jgi:hypothetical protein
MKPDGSRVVDLPMSPQNKKIKIRARSYSEVAFLWITNFPALFRVWRLRQNSGTIAEVDNPFRAVRVNHISSPRNAGKQSAIPGGRRSRYWEEEDIRWMQIPMKNNSFDSLEILWSGRLEQELNADLVLAGVGWARKRTAVAGARPVTFPVIAGESQLPHTYKENRPWKA